MFHSSSVGIQEQKEVNATQVELFMHDKSLIQAETLSEDPWYFVSSGGIKAAQTHVLLEYMTAEIP